MSAGQGEQVEELRNLIAKATDSNLTDDGRYFHDTCDDLTKCYHGDTGEYQCEADGKLVEWLWNHRNEIADLYEARHRSADSELVEALAAVQDGFCKAYCTWAALDDHPIEHHPDCARARQALSRAGETT